MRREPNRLPAQVLIVVVSLALIAIGAVLAFRLVTAARHYQTPGQVWASCMVSAAENGEPSAACGPRP